MSDINMPKGASEERLRLIYRAFSRRGSEEALRKMDMMNFNDWEKGFEYFFDKFSCPILKLIIIEYMYRHFLVANKRLNFYGMLFALEHRLLPANHFPEAFSINAKTKPIEEQIADAEIDDREGEGEPGD